MNYKIKKAAVLGAGVMGSAIAAHLANIGIPCYLLDILPASLSDEEKSKGLTLENPLVRNRFALQSIKSMRKAKPSPLYSQKNVELIMPGNIHDHLSKLTEVDWIIEAVIENLEIKRDLLSKVEQYRKSSTIVSSNTSGVSINAMVEHLPEDFQKHFLGTHFFNPPRYMKLLEIIPCKQTLPEVVHFMKKFGEEQLGKGIVDAKDTPNFIANRIGVFGIITCMNLMQEMGLTVTEVDAITGPALGRPKSASFRTMDMVGLDTFVHVANNVYSNLTDEKERSSFQLPKFVHQMIENKLLGQKAGKGFYQKTKHNGKSKISALNYQTLEYQEEAKPEFASLTASKAAGGFKAGLTVLLSAQDKAGEFAWQNIKKILLYTASKLGEIADNVVSIDKAMQWGFNWKVGPFELWDTIGLAKSITRMEKEGEVIPEFIKEMLALGFTSFYKQEANQQYFYDVVNKQYVLLEESPKKTNLKLAGKTDNIVLENSGARLIDIGDNIYCLEFDSPKNAIGADILNMINNSVEYVANNGDGLIIGNQGSNFCVGANLMAIFMEAQDEEWDEIDFMVRMFQKTMMTIKYSPKPVVSAPFNMCLGGGCEIVMHSHRVRAAAETYMGLVELGVGLIPAGGGTKESAARAGELADREQVELQSLINRAFERIAMAKVSTSGQEAIELGYLQPTDKLSINSDFLIHDAKATVLAMVREGYRQLQPKPIRVVGQPGLAVLKLATYTMREAGYISEYDQHLANKLAYVITGGNVPANTYVTEEYLLDLEREAFLSLCGDQRTQARIHHMLTKGKPLRN